MSGDNYTYCPKCMQQHKRSMEAWELEVRNGYGVLSQEAYELLKMSPPIEPDQYGLREDYEIGINGDGFFVRYEASCKVCDFGFRYKEEIDEDDLIAQSIDRNKEYKPGWRV